MAIDNENSIKLLQTTINIPVYPRIIDDANIKISSGENYANKKGRETCLLNTNFEYF
jgi:hypothetical protein